MTKSCYIQTTRFKSTTHRKWSSDPRPRMYILLCGRGPGPQLGSPGRRPRLDSYTCLNRLSPGYIRGGGSEAIKLYLRT